MKPLGLLFVVLVPAAIGAQVGETFDQLIAEKGKPKSEINAGPMRVLTYPDVTIKLRDNVIISVTAVKAVSPAAAAPSSSNMQPLPREAQIAQANQIENRAVVAVQAIVNQPITTLPRTPSMRVGNYGEGWFHPGAIKPDFAKVDIRQTQEKQYDKFEYVSSDLNPGVVFVGNELEFNSMTKLFYTDRKLPKKKLTEREMLEINHQYRIIAQCEQTLSELQPK